MQSSVKKRKGIAGKDANEHKSLTPAKCAPTIAPTAVMSGAVVSPYEKPAPPTPQTDVPAPLYPPVSAPPSYPLMYPQYPAMSGYNLHGHMPYPHYQPPNNDSQCQNYNSFAPPAGAPMHDPSQGGYSIYHHYGMHPHSMYPPRPMYNQPTSSLYPTSPARPHQGQVQYGGHQPSGSNYSGVQQPAPSSFTAPRPPLYPTSPGTPNTLKGKGILKQTEDAFAPHHPVGWETAVQPQQSEGGNMQGTAETLQDSSLTPGGTSGVTPIERKNALRRERRALAKDLRDQAAQNVAVGRRKFFISCDELGNPEGPARNQWMTALRGQCQRLLDWSLYAQDQPLHLIEKIMEILASDWEYGPPGLNIKAITKTICGQLKYQRNKLFKNYYSVGLPKPHHVPDKTWAQLVVSWGSTDFKKFQANGVKARGCVKNTSRSGRSGISGVVARLVYFSYNIGSSHIVLH